MYEHNYLIKLTGYNFLLYFFFLKKKAEIYPKEKVLANLVFGNFKYHEGYYKYLEGDLNHQADCYKSASDYYDNASRILESIMKDEGNLSLSSSLLTMLTNFVLKAISFNND
jgi:hypothetical protein